MTHQDSASMFSDFMENSMQLIIFVGVVGGLFTALITVIAGINVAMVALIPVVFGAAVLAIMYRHNILGKGGL